MKFDALSTSKCPHRRIFPIVPTLLLAPTVIILVDHPYIVMTMVFNPSTTRNANPPDNVPPPHQYLHVYYPLLLRLMNVIMAYLKRTHAHCTFLIHYGADIYSLFLVVFRNFLVLSEELHSVVARVSVTFVIQLLFY